MKELLSYCEENGLNPGPDAVFLHQHIFSFLFDKVIMNSKLKNETTLCFFFWVVCVFLYSHHTIILVWRKATWIEPSAKGRTLYRACVFLKNQELYGCMAVVVWSASHRCLPCKKNLSRHNRGALWRKCIYVSFPWMIKKDMFELCNYSSFLLSRWLIRLLILQSKTQELHKIKYLAK